MFLKPANSDTKNGIKQIKKKSPEKFTAETGKDTF